MISEDEEEKSRSSISYAPSVSVQYTQDMSVEWENSENNKT